LDNNPVDKVIEVIRERDDFLITAHVNPEGDSVGSQLALFDLLEKLGKKAIIVDNDGVPANLRFLPGNERIVSALPEDIKPRVALILDCPVKFRAGSVVPDVDRTELVVNIDHHVSNEFFGDVNWVDPEASSVGEMIYRLYEAMEVEVDAGGALSMYTAIVTDTGMFNYENTSARTHTVASELMKKGVKPARVFHHVYEDKSPEQTRMLGRVLQTVEITDGGKVASMALTASMYDEEGISDVPTEEFINHVRAIKGVEVAIFFKQRTDERDKVDISFRSSGRVDVNHIASRLGGGGHTCASGCKLECGLEGAKEKVLEEVRKAVAGIR